MPAYARLTVREFVKEDVTKLVGCLQQGYASDGFVSQYTRQTKAWVDVIPDIQNAFLQLVDIRPDLYSWTILFEYPLYRLRRRIDIVILAGNLILVIECKVGAEAFTVPDSKQVEEYALDLRDFHAGSSKLTIVPILWSTRSKPVLRTGSQVQQSSVASVIYVGSEGLKPYLASLPIAIASQSIAGEKWDHSAYRPVPSVIEAATSIFAGHDVRSIANADADNLHIASAFLIAKIKQAREENRRFLLILTGVPGSGKTLAGLDVVHSSISTGIEQRGDIIYLSGNTPLVEVLREALAQDENRRRKMSGQGRNLDRIRGDVRARIQHINDFLKQSLRGSPDLPPHEHVIVFDEAQRAWNKSQGQKKFGREESEPELILNIMSRHQDWCVCICLIGSGQEINAGEEGVRGWGNAIRQMQSESRHNWNVFAPPEILDDGISTNALTLGSLPPEITTYQEADLRLTVPQRSFRSPNLSHWVNKVLDGDKASARLIAQELSQYPLVITRSLDRAKLWLRENGRGERRYGLVASSGARRLRADGLGVSLMATDRTEIARWYLQSHGDVRSSFALEVPANEYTCQGLELDFVCVCWGGDFLWNEVTQNWSMARFSGTAWQKIRNQEARRFLVSSYRVLLTRAREGMILWLPLGDDSDSTRAVKPLDHTAAFLMHCGATSIDATQG